MRYRAPFQLFKKTLKSGSKIYYYTTYDKLNKRRQYSTGCKSKSEALKYCMEQYKKDQLIVDKSTIFSVYTAKWFIYDECPYIQSVLARGKKYSRASALAKRSTLLHKIYPYFQDMKLENITPLHIENWLVEIKKSNVSNTTINLYLSDLKLILKEAYRTDVIKNNPGLKVNRLVKKPKARGTYTDDEVAKLFDENRKDEIWEEEAIYLMNLISSQTGMRLGEIQSLQAENIYKDHIVVKYTWQRQFGLKEPKNGKPRIVPISSSLNNKIKVYIKNNPVDGKFIFSRSNGMRPISHMPIYRITYKAFKLIGISPEDRVKRNLTIHSWRHYYNTLLLKKNVPKAIIQAIIGHATDDMTENYTKLTKDDLLKAI